MESAVDLKINTAKAYSNTLFTILVLRISESAWESEVKFTFFLSFWDVEDRQGFKQTTTQL